MRTVDNFKCRLCGCREYEKTMDIYYYCPQCSSMFISPVNFSLNREIRIKYLPHYNIEEWGKLDFKHLHDTGIDLRAAIKEPITIIPQKERTMNVSCWVKIPFGIKIEPSHYDMDFKIYNRSGLASKHGVRIRNCVGITDCTYRGEVMGFFINDGEFSYTINPGDRVAQLVAEKRLDVEVVTVDKLSDTIRDEGGFGSTGRI